MQIKNQTKDLVVAEEYELCDSTLRRAIGLMFSPPKTLVFEFAGPQIVYLHMLFVFFPIDIVFVDTRKKVVDIKHAKPFQPHISSKNMAKYIIETPDAGKTEIGDQLEF